MRPPSPLLLARARRRNTGGFTFLEVVIGMALLLWIIAGVCVGGSRVITQLDAQREVVSAGQAIQERIEQIRGVAYLQLVDAVYVQNTLMTRPTNSETALNALSEKLTLSPFPADGSTPLQVTRRGGAVTLDSTSPALATCLSVRVDLQLTWQNRGGRSRTREISTIVSNGGINR